MKVVCIDDCMIRFNSSCISAHGKSRVGPAELFRSLQNSFPTDHFPLHYPYPGLPHQDHAPSINSDVLQFSDIMGIIVAVGVEDALQLIDGSRYSCMYLSMSGWRPTR